MRIATAVSVAAQPESKTVNEDKSLGIELFWDAPTTGCPDGPTLRSEVLRLAQVPVTGPKQRPLVARVRVEQTSAGTWRLSLVTELGATQGERVLSGRSCQSVCDAAALTLALILNPAAEPPRRGVPSSDDRPSGAVGPSDRQEHGGAGEERAGGPSFAWFAAGRVGMQVGVLPMPGPEFAVGLGMAYGGLSAWALGSHALAQDAEVQGQHGRGGRLSTMSATMVGCWTPSSAVSWMVGPCLGGELTRLEGHGIGVTAPQDGVIVWPSGLLGLATSLPWGSHLVLRLSGAAVIPFARPKALLDEIGTVHQPFILGGRILVGLDYRLP